MKKLLPLTAMLILIMTACGASEEDKAKAQKEAENKVNEIINQLEASAEEEEPAMEMDTTVADTTVADSAATDTTGAE